MDRYNRSYVSRDTNTYSAQTHACLVCKCRFRSGPLLQQHLNEQGHYLQLRPRPSLRTWRWDNNYRATYERRVDWRSGYASRRESGYGSPASQRLQLRRQRDMEFRERDARIWKKNLDYGANYDGSRERFKDDNDRYYGNDDYRHEQRDSRRNSWECERRRSRSPCPRRRSDSLDGAWAKPTSPIVDAEVDGCGAGEPVVTGMGSPTANDGHAVRSEVDGDGEVCKRDSVPRTPDEQRKSRTKGI